MSLFAVSEAAGPPPLHHVVTTHQGDNADLIAAVARLYLSEGARVADVTYGKGVFWRQVDLSRVALFGSDKEMGMILRRAQVPLFATYDPVLLAADFGALPYRAAVFDVVVLDPPYLHNPGHIQMERTYRNVATTGGMYHRDILRDCYCLGLQEAWRVLAPGGTVWVKGKDEVESGRQCWSHAEVCTAAERLGFVALDQFFLVTQGGQAARPGQAQQHARKNQSWLWVFKRPPSPPVTKRGRPKKGSVVTTIKQQRGRGYWQARLLKEHPQIYARYLAGELPSVHAAAKMAGLIKGR
jgi:hypothetical protein